MNYMYTHVRSCYVRNELTREWFSQHGIGNFCFPFISQVKLKISIALAMAESSPSPQAPLLALSAPRNDRAEHCLPHLFRIRHLSSLDQAIVARCLSSSRRHSSVQYSSAGANFRDLKISLRLDVFHYLTLQLPEDETSSPTT